LPATSRSKSAVALSPVGVAVGAVDDDLGLVVAIERDGLAGGGRGKAGLSRVVQHRHVAGPEDGNTAVLRQAHRVEADDLRVQRQGAQAHRVVADVAEQSGELGVERDEAALAVHLAGELVQIQVDGQFQSESLSVDNTGQLVGVNDTSGDVVRIGKRITMQMTPNLIEQPDQSGNTQGRLKSANDLKVLTNNSVGGVVTDDSVNEFPIRPFVLGAEVAVTGWTENLEGVTLNGTRPLPTIKHTTPHDFEVLSVSLELEVRGN